MEHFQKIELRRTRDFGEKFNATFEFIRQNYKGFMPAVLYISIPLIVIGMVIANYYSNFVMYKNIGEFGSENAIAPFISSLFGFVGIAYIFIVAGYLINTSLVYNYMKLYMIRDNPTSITVKELWDESKKYIGSIFVASILIGIVVVIGMVFLIIPGVYLAVVLSLLISVIIFEDKSIGDAFSRCFLLIKDKWWSTFGLIFVASILQGTMGLIFSIPDMIINVTILLHRDGDLLADPPMWQKGAVVLTSCISAIGTGLLTCISFIAIAFQYFNLVERREATGLMNKIETFGKTDSINPDPKETY